MNFSYILARFHHQIRIEATICAHEIGAENAQVSISGCWQAPAGL
jgi:hypothetical protein